MNNNEILVRKAIEDKEREASSYEDQGCYNAAYCYGQTRIEMTEKEKELFRKSLVDKLRITMDTEGNLSIGLS